jgi:L-lactate dehydrogenase
MARLVDIINNDNRAILTICTPVAEIEGIKNVTLSLPHLIGGDGDLGALPLRLDANERGLLKKSAQLIRDRINEYEKK